MDKNELQNYLKIPVGIALAMMGSWVRSLSSNTKGKKRFAGVMTSGFCGLLLWFVSEYSGWNGPLFLILCSITGWVGGDVVLNAITDKFLNKLKGTGDNANQ